MTCLNETLYYSNFDYVGLHHIKASLKPILSLVSDLNRPEQTWCEMYERLFIRNIPALCVSLNYVPEAESDDLLSAGRRGVSCGGPGHHGAVHCQVESSLQDEENCKTF